MATFDIYSRFSEYFAMGSKSLDISAKIVVPMTEHLVTRTITLLLTLRNENCATVLHMLPYHADVQSKKDDDAVAKLATLLPAVSPNDISLSSLKRRLRSTSFNHIQVGLSN